MHTSRLCNSSAEELGQRPYAATRSPLLGNRQLGSTIQNWTEDAYGLVPNICVQICVSGRLDPRPTDEMFAEVSHLD